MNPPVQTVVLAGGDLPTRQRLAQQLQQRLTVPEGQHLFLCPAEPSDLAQTPASARYLLWRNPRDTASEPQASLWREQLHRWQRPYQSLQADEASLLQQAIYALAPGVQSALAREEITGRWQGFCECCADPVCEQKLFGRLLQG